MTLIGLKFVVLASVVVVGECTVLGLISSYSLCSVIVSHTTQWHKYRTFAPGLAGFLVFFARLLGQLHSIYDHDYCQAYWVQIAWTIPNTKAHRNIRLIRHLEWKTEAVKE